MRVAIGPKDLENGVVELARRDTLIKETQPLENVENYIKELLIKIQEKVYTKALKFRDENITKVDSYRRI